MSNSPFGLSDREKVAILKGVPTAARKPQRKNEWEFRTDETLDPGTVKTQYFPVEERGLITAPRMLQKVFYINPEAMAELNKQIEETVLKMPQTVVREGYEKFSAAPGQPPAKPSPSLSELGNLRKSINNLVAQLTAAKKPLRPDQVVEFTKKYALLRDQMKIMRKQMTEVEGGFEMVAIKLVDVVGEE